MNEIRKQWVAALRSGRYKQGTTGPLTTTDYEYCCLGVLCDVLGLKRQRIGNQFTYEGTGTSLASKELRDTVGLRTQFGDISRLTPELAAKAKSPMYPVSPNGSTALTTLNDNGVPFSVIADIIEAEPEGLFTD